MDAKRTVVASYTLFVGLALLSADPVAAKLLGAALVSLTLGALAVSLGDAIGYFGSSRAP